MKDRETPRDPLAVVSAARALVEADDAVDQEAKAAEATGRALSSAPAVRRIRAWARLREVLTRFHGSAPREQSAVERWRSAPEPAKRRVLAALGSERATWSGAAECEAWAKGPREAAAATADAFDAVVQLALEAAGERPADPASTNASGAPPGGPKVPPSRPQEPPRRRSATVTPPWEDVRLVARAAVVSMMMQARAESALYVDSGDEGVAARARMVVNAIDAALARLAEPAQPSAAERWRADLTVLASAIDRAQTRLDSVPKPCTATTLAIGELQTAAERVSDALLALAREAEGGA